MQRLSPCALFTLAALPFVLLHAGCNGASELHPAPVDQPAILASVPHDTSAFTQGLLIDGDVWLESTGQYGQSELREVERETGRIIRSHALPRNLFGEGLAHFNNQLYQLTWHAGLCLVYDRETFEVTGHFRYEGEGWGLTSCDQWLYMSNGSETIQVRDPQTFRTVRTFTVQDHAGPVTRLNELEWIQGEIWANIFKTKTIVRFDPQSGHVTGYLNLDHLPLPGDEHPDQDVLNGIAYDPANQTIWVTGKNWSRLYQLDWTPLDSSR